MQICKVLVLLWVDFPVVGAQGKSALRRLVSHSEITDGLALEVGEQCGAAKHFIR